MKKRIFSLLLAVSVLMSTSALAAAEFSDVAKSDYFYDAVNWGVEAGITSGVGDNLFAPEGEVTRAQVVTFLWNKAGKPIVEATETFSDVEEGSWYENAVAWAVENKITAGTGDNMFSPDAVCSRAMCITFLYRLMGSPFDAADALESVDDDESSTENMTLEELSNFITKSIIDSYRESGIILDVKSDDYYELAVFYAAISGILDENTAEISEEGVKFYPNDACVRKEMISFLYRTKLLEDMANAPIEVYFGDDLILPEPKEYYDNEVLAMEIYGLSSDEYDEEYEDEDELGIIVSESASKNAAEALGEDTEGQGELFRIIRVSEKRLHDLLCGDMSGMNVFAKDEKDRYYIICYPTDVRYVRESNEKMDEDIEKWTELNEWARDNLGNKIIERSRGLSPVAFTNTTLDMYLARIAYAKDIKYTVSAAKYGKLAPGKFDCANYAEYLIGGNFAEAEGLEAPEGEYITLDFSDEGVHYDFFTQEKNLVREVRGEDEKFYKCVFEGDASNYDTVQDWYLAIAEKLGKK